MAYSSIHLHAQLLQKTKVQLVKASTRNTAKRLNEILDIVQQSLPTSFEAFIINKNNMKQIFQDIKTCILSWQGNEIINCATHNGYVHASIQWFAKNNAKIYGNCLFYPVFVHILRFCNKINGMDNNTKIHLFISIMLKILNANITNIGKYNASQSLIPAQCLIYPNKFRSILKEFIRHFNIECEVDNIITSKTVSLFIHLLYKMENILLNANNEGVEYNLFTIKLPPAPMLCKTESKSTDSEISISDITINTPKLQSQSPLMPICSNNNNATIQNQQYTHENNTIGYIYDINESNAQQNITSYTNNIFINNINNSNEVINEKKINSIVVPLNKHQTIKYKIISFNPLCVEKEMLQ